MEKLSEIKALVIKQKKEIPEILTGIETKNKYSIMNESGEEIFFAKEESSFISRFFLKMMRPFKIHILSKTGEILLTFQAPFRFFFRELNVYDNSGKFLGKIKRKFSIFSREFSVSDETGNEIYTVYAPFFHPWTFKIIENGTQTGQITKKFSGIGTELFTDADNFAVVFPENANPEKKAVLLGTLFLIDMMFFEN